EDGIRDDLVTGVQTFALPILRAAKFNEVTTLEGFDFSYNPKVPAATIRDLAALGFVEACESVILYGPVGVGKTHVAQALGHQARSEERRVGGGGWARGARRSW